MIHMLKEYLFIFIESIFFFSSFRFVTKLKGSY